MKALFFFLCLGVFINASFGQWTISADPVGGTPIKGQSYQGIKGSPYLFADWAKGRVTLSDGSSYTNIDLLYDMLAEQLVFKDKAGNTLAFNKPVSGFSLIEPTTGDTLNFIQLSGVVGYLEILVDGEAPLYKKTVKSLVDQAATFGQPNQIKNVLTSSTYYTVVDQQLVKFKTVDDLERIFPGENIAERQKQYRLNIKKEADLIRLFDMIESEK
ncbi:hypothetical protein SAMN05660226_01919 [Parapedobacter luteus]|uniref:DUF4369 domain-containing protein n=1 Tax=Parapedobacter luteus TaxID=623280 RepID=A0A1T5C758_9SPHI|nr:hypothetical protein [Parapedobacter luteus]SKB55247.1 hypothetical protein SAMN05660226_01919 [Parapedobacter luteus]